MSSGNSIEKLSRAEEDANREIAKAKARRQQSIQEAKAKAADRLREIREKFQADFEQQEAQARFRTYCSIPLFILMSNAMFVLI